jgi:hypothetical protein
MRPRRPGRLQLLSDEAHLNPREATDRQWHRRVFARALAVVCIENLIRID